jgi:RHS repeat-associated protein
MKLSYTRGNDLSGSLEGAGGIGGLLGRTAHSGTGGTNLTHAFYHADGNGNITSLIDDHQNIRASYKYDPFGNTISQSGDLADANVYRFSSKEIHVNSGLYYYGYRFYDPNLQRWINRDPIEERGGINLYTYVINSPISTIDPYGHFGYIDPHLIFPPKHDSPIACGAKIRDEVWEKYGKNRGENDPSARKAHCIAHCRITWLGGFGKEIQDAFHKGGGSGGEGYDPGDMAANAKGRKCAKNKDKTCEEQCTDALNKGDLYPPPPDVNYPPFISIY